MSGTFTSSPSLVCDWKAGKRSKEERGSQVSADRPVRWPKLSGALPFAGCDQVAQGLLEGASSGLHMGNSSRQAELESGWRTPEPK